MNLDLIFLLLLQYIDCAGKYFYSFIVLFIVLDITVQPVSINTTLNSTAVFSCEAVADDLSFRVNNESAHDTGVMDKGFSATSTNNGGTIRAELQAIAYDYNNNTEVKCRAINDDPVQILFSNTSILMIQG